MRKIFIHNQEIILKQIIKRAGLPYLHKFYLDMRMHPCFPSFQSLSYILTKIGIENYAIRTSYSHLNELPLPFVIHVKTNLDFFLMVKKVDDANIKVLNSRNQMELIKIDSFLKMWDGFVMVMNYDDTPSIKVTIFQKMIDLLISKKKQIIIFSISLPFLYIYAKKLVDLTFNAATFIILYTCGVLFTVLIEIHDVDRANLFISKICGYGKKNNGDNCSSVLDSNGSKLFHIIHLSDMGLLYMLSMLIINFVLPAKDAITISTIFSFAVFPFVFYSLAYQKYKAKHWCIMCLTVIFILLLLFVNGLMVLGSMKATFFDIETFKVIFDIFFIALFTFALLMILKPLLITHIAFKTLDNKYNKLKYDDGVFCLLQKEQPSFPAQPYGNICIGKKSASNVFLLVYNPMCSECQNELKILLDFIEKKQEVQLQIVFFYDRREQPISYRISRFLLNAYYDNPSKFVLIIKEYINSFPNYDRFLKNDIISNPEVDRVLSDSNNWCVSNKFAVTPISILNNRLLNTFFSAQDIDYIFN